MDRAGLSRVIAVINVKGGVGKTTVAANLGGLLAASGYRVLLVDLDPQGNLGEELGYSGTEVDDGGRALALSMTTGAPLVPVPDVRPGLDVVTGGPELDPAAAHLVLAAQADPQAAKRSLIGLLGETAPDYDVVLLDCPPGQEPLQQAALAAARWALIPVKTDASSRKGLRDVARRLDTVLDLNPDLDLLGVLLFGVNRGAHRVIESARAAVAEDLGDDAPVLRTTIRHVEAAAQEARDRGLLVHELEEAVMAAPAWWQIRRGTPAGDGPRSRSVLGLAEDFQALGSEVIERIGAAEQAEEAASAGDVRAAAPGRPGAQVDPGAREEQGGASTRRTRPDVLQGA